MSEKYTLLLIIVVVVLVVFTAEVWSFSSGPPTSTCLTKFPKHDNIEKQQIQSPFRVTVDPNIYEQSQIITVSLEAYEYVDNQFKGIHVSAHRKSGNTEEVIGTFSKVPIEKMKTLSCLGGKNNVAIHKNNDPVDYLEIEWLAPLNYGDIEIRATFVENFTTFWTDVKAEVKVKNTDGIVYPSYSLPVVNEFSAIKWEECGVNRGCFRHPATCTGNNCDVRMTFKANINSSYTFDMEARAEGYVAMALSKDKIMGDDESTLCTSDGNKFSIQRGFNPKHYVDKQYTKGFTNVEIRQVDGKIMCRFTRPKITTVYMGQHWFNLTEPWYIQMAWGSTFKDTDVIMKHKDTPIISHSMVKLYQYGIHTISSSSNQVSSLASLFKFIIVSVLFIYV